MARKTSTLAGGIMSALNEFFCGLGCISAYYIVGILIVALLDVLSSCQKDRMFQGKTVESVAFGIALIWPIVVLAIPCIFLVVLCEEIWKVLKGTKWAKIRIKFYYVEDR